MLVLFLVIGIVGIYFAGSNINAATAGNNSQSNNNDSTAIRFATLSVATDRIKYVEGQSITITGTIYDEQGNPVKLPINVKVQEMFYKESEIKEDNKTKTNSTLMTGRTVYGINLIPNNGTYSVVIDRGLMEGKYNITSYISYATANQSKISTQPGTSTVIDVDGFFNSTPVRTLIIGILVGVFGIFALVAWNYISSHRTRDGKGIHEETAIYELCQFVIITIFAFTPIVTLAFTDVAIFPNSPIGVVIKPSSENVTQSAGEWMINVGGSSFDRYQSGIQVPIAIFIFGILGGYLKYLYFIVKRPDHKKKNAKLQTNSNLVPHENLYTMLKQLTFLFLSPLLAIAVWLVLRQGGVTSVLTLSAVSFVIGLVTDEAVSSLIRFVTGALREPKTVGQPQQPVPKSKNEKTETSEDDEEVENEDTSK